MKYTDFANKVKEITEFEPYHNNITLRFLGLCYDKYMYRKQYANLEKHYEPEEVLSAMRNAKEYINNHTFNDNKHKLNSFVLATKRNLEWGNFISSEEIEDNFEL